jgi:hypothetical protein
VFGALKTWNPQNIPSDKNPEFMRRLVVVEQPPFGGDRWTHIVITWSGLNARGGSASLFLNGKRIGTERQIGEMFEWDAGRLAIRLGVNYTGMMDELAAFDRVLSDREIAELNQAGTGTPPRAR